MPVLAMKMDLGRLHALLQSESGRARFTELYPNEMALYNPNRFNSPMVQAVLKAMWQMEMERDGQSFCEYLEGATT